MLKQKSQKKRRVSKPESSDKTSALLIVLGVCFIGVFVLGIYIGNNGVAAGSAGVAIATAAARSKVKKMRAEADSLSASVSLIVSDSVKIESHGEQLAQESSDEHKKSTRDSLDTGDSAWERVSIFPDP